MNKIAQNDNERRHGAVEEAMAPQEPAVPPQSQNGDTALADIENTYYSKLLEERWTES